MNKKQVVEKLKKLGFEFRARDPKAKLEKLLVENTKTAPPKAKKDEKPKAEKKAKGAFQCRSCGAKQSKAVNPCSECNQAFVELAPETAAE